MGNFLEKYGFEPDKYFKFVDGVVYRNVAAGLIEEGKPFKKAFRRVGDYKIYAAYHRCNLSYTIYYIIVDGVVYSARWHTSLCSVINDMVEDLELLAKGYRTI